MARGCARGHGPALLALVLAGLLGATGCGVRSQPPAPEAGIVTPEEAHHVATDAFQVLSDAWVAHRTGGFADVTAGAALAVFTNDVIRSRAGGATAGAPIPPPDGIQVFVPRQHGYPAHFLARESYDDTSVRRNRLVVYRNDGDPSEGVGGWKLVVTVAEADEVDTGRRIHLDAEGYAATVPDLGPLAPRYDPSRLDSSLAAYLNRWDEPEVPEPEIFEEGVQTTGLIEETREYRSTSEEQGASWTTEFTPSGFGTYVYASRDGGAVAFFSVRERQHWESRTGEPVSVTGETATRLGADSFLTLDQENLFLLAADVPSPAADRVVGWLGATATTGPLAGT